MFYLLSALPILIGFISFVLNGYFRYKIFHIEPGNMMVGLAVELLLQTLFFSYRYRFLNLNIIKLAEEKFVIEKNVGQSILEAQEMERVKISEDLHDQLGNDFLGLQLITNKVAQLNAKEGFPINENLITEMKNLTNEMSVHVRYLTHALAKINIQENGLIQLIENRLALINSNGTIRFRFEHLGDIESITNISKISIFRIILEAINNIIKHSEASEAYLKLFLNEKEISLTIVDNGKGFMLNEKQNGIGLHTMKGRADALKGRLEIKTILGSGCTIQLIIPTNNHINK